MSQMACVLESWTWIQHACRACHFHIRDPTFAGMPRERVQLIQFAYWTCHQLEGDLLAELDLVPSCITVHASATATPGNQENRIAHPPIPNELTPPEDDIRRHYNNQIALRNSLNDYQKMLYPHQLYERETATFGFNKRTACDETLMTWRAALPTAMRWGDTDAPPATINAARLRAKYYGAKYIIHRPLLYMALEYDDHTLDLPAVRHRFREYLRRPDRFALVEKLPEETEASEDERRIERAVQILMSCRMCIDAAKRSTTAFDGIWPQKRLIVTNIFGTAHA